MTLDDIEDLEGVVLRGKYREAGLDIAVGGRKPSWFDWEMYILDEAKAWERVTFYFDGQVHPNPFTR
ncbi:hypothetical protein [Actinoplanes sp. NPDC051859]|uniref:hypothetical protein n=1 Tax=Actinoplanes sp. NPDC051859 TaxID=3363909 RepID=UPI00379762C7